MPHTLTTTLDSGLGTRDSRLADPHFPNPAESDHRPTTETVKPRAESRPAWDRADWGDLLSAMRREIDSASDQRHDGVEVTAPFVAVARTVAPISDERVAEPSMAASVAGANGAPGETAACLPVEQTGNSSPTGEAVASESPQEATQARTKRVRRVPPQDEFGFFDPRQCGFTALFAKVNAIKENANATAKKPA